MSISVRSDDHPSDSVSPLLSSTHEATLLLKLTLNDNSSATFAPLPDTSPRDIIPLDDFVLYPKSTTAYVTCCQTHANSLKTPFFNRFAGTPNAPVPNHRPSVLLHSAHVRRHPELERPSNARRYAIIWNPRRYPLQFAFNEIICPCCPEHAEQLMLNHRDTFSAYSDEIEEMNLTSMPTVSRTTTPDHDVLPDSERLSVKPSPVPSNTNVSAVPAPQLSHAPVSLSPSHSAMLSQLEPQRSTDPLNYHPSHGYVDWSDDDPLTGPPPPPTRSQVLRHYQQRPIDINYASVTNRAPAPVISSPVTTVPRNRPNVPLSPILPMSESIPQYVTDPERPFYKLNFENIATVLRCEMLLCLHVLDFPHPSRDAMTAARRLLATDIQNQHGLRTTLGNYSFALSSFAEHLQDYHVNGIRSSSESIKQSVSYDEHNCGILRCIFYYREGPHVDATVYLQTFNPLNAYHMLLSRLNEVRHENAPRLKVSIINQHSTSKTYRLPSSDFDVTLNDRDPQSLSEIPSSTRSFYPHTPTSSRGSTRSTVRRVTRPRPQ